ncbi:MAG TPA: hypothetical protein VKH81_08490 [Candidatus Angelobacter sp.]|nr:hypothetical protein [Candidatus Angelobacter sp.]
MAQSFEVEIFRKPNSEGSEGNNGAPAAPVVAAEEPSVRETALQSKIDELLGTISEMQSRAASQEAEAQRIAGDQRVKEAKATAAGNGEKVGIGRQDFLITKAINDVGGLAKFHRLTTNEKLRLMGSGPTNEQEQALASKYFGAKSDSMQAALLRRSDPTQYLRLRLIHRVTAF